MDLLHNLVGLGGQPDPGGLGVDDDQDGVGAVLPNQVVDQDVVLVQLWPRVVPADNALLGVHGFQVLVVQEPNIPILVVL